MGRGVVWFRKPHVVRSVALAALACVVVLGWAGVRHTRRTGEQGNLASRAAACPSTTTWGRDKVSVTLALQSTHDRAWLVDEHCRRFHGPIVLALALFPGSPTKPPTLPSCGPSQLHFVSVHLEEHEQVDYPVNRMRNIAISHVNTTHYLTLDIDFLTNDNLYEEILLQRAALAHDKTALIVPAFELEADEGCDATHLPCRLVPQRYEDLVQMPEVVPFHLHKTPDAHSTTDYTKYWHQEPHALREVACFQSEIYEPYVVLRRSADTPLYDERFFGYARNKVEQVNHLRMAGFRFEVLARCFAVHNPHELSPAKQNNNKKDNQKGQDHRQQMNALYDRLRGERQTKFGLFPPTPLCIHAVDVRWITALHSLDDVRAIADTACDKFSWWAIVRVPDAKVSRAMQSELVERGKSVVVVDFDPALFIHMSPPAPTSRGNGRTAAPFFDAPKGDLEAANNARRQYFLSDMAACLGAPDQCEVASTIRRELSTDTPLKFSHSFVPRKGIAKSKTPGEVLKSMAEHPNGLGKELLDLVTNIHHQLVPSFSKRSLLTFNAHALRLEREALHDIGSDKSSVPPLVADLRACARQALDFAVVPIGASDRPGVFRVGTTDHQRLEEFVRNTLCLAVASQLDPSASARFGERAALNIRQWFVNPRTSMRPTAELANGQGLHELLALAGIADGIKLVAPDHLTTDDMRRVEAWFGTDFARFLDSNACSTARESLGLDGTAHDVLRITAASFADDAARAAWTVFAAPHRLREQVSRSGLLHVAMDRGKSAPTVMRALHALLLLARIAANLALPLTLVNAPGTAHRGSSLHELPLLKAAVVAHHPAFSRAFAQLLPDWDAVTKEWREYLLHSALALYPELDHVMLRPARPMWCSKAATGTAPLPLWSFGLSTTLSLDRHLVC